MSISVVICAHTLDRADLLRAALDSVRAQTFPAHEIILVVDHNPELLAMFSAEYPGVKTIANKAEAGLSGARNTGVEQAVGRIVAFLDDDATAEPDWLEVLHAAYDDPDVIAAGGSIAPLWPTARPAWFPREFDWVVGCSYLGLPEGAGPVRNLIGCNMSMLRDQIDPAGGFKEGLGRVGDNAAGCEETELFVQMQMQAPGGKILYDPRARVRHTVAPSRTGWRYFVKRCKAEGRGKARMRRTVGTRRALSSEAAYVRKTLPAGIGRGVADALRGDPSGLSRAGAIVAGFAVTSGSYAMERARILLTGAPPVAPFRPYVIVDADIAQGLPTLPSRDPSTGAPYGAAWCLIRSSGQPVKILEVPFDGAAIGPGDLAKRIRSDPMPVPPLPIPPADGPNAPHVTVVIATRDRPASLRVCLDSLLAQTYRAMDIVVVDNAPPSDATADLIAAHYVASGRVTYVRENAPGLGRAHNRGIVAAKGEVLAFTDDDVIVDPAWVSAIAANFAFSPEIGCVTGLILPAELQTQAQIWTERHGGFGKGLSRRVFDIATGHADDPLFPYAAGKFGSGANMAFRRETLARMGGFDPALGAGTYARGGDDLASFVAALKTGSQLAYEPGAIVWHHHRRSEEGMRNQAFGYGVGLGAYLGKQVFDDPRLLVLFARKLPAAFAHLFSRTSDKMARLPSDYPRALVWRERLGILVGAPRYAISRFKVRSTPFHATRPVPASAHDG